MRSRSPPRSGGLLQLDGRTHLVSCPGLNLKKLVNCWKLWGFQVFLSNHNIASFHWKILRRETLKYWAPGGELQGKFDKGLEFFTFFPETLAENLWTDVEFLKLDAERAPVPYFWESSHNFAKSSAQNYLILTQLQTCHFDRILCRQRTPQKFLSDKKFKIIFRSPANLGLFSEKKWEGFRVA